MIIVFRTELFRKQIWSKSNEEKFLREYLFSIYSHRKINGLQERLFETITRNNSAFEVEDFNFTSVSVIKVQTTSHLEYDNPFMT